MNSDTRSKGFTQDTVDNLLRCDGIYIADDAIYAQAASENLTRAAFEST